VASTENTARTDLQPRENFSGFWHAVQLYESDAFLADSVAYFIHKGLETGCGALIIATAAHQEAIDQALRARGADPSVARASGQYIAIDAAETLDQIMVDGWPDAQRFNRLVGAALWTLAERNCSSVRAFGEMVTVLWASGRHEAALHLEKLWNSLSSRHKFSLLCAYPLNCFSGEGQAPLVLEMCSSHSHVIPAETYAKCGPATHMASRSSPPDAGLPPIA